jgi:hypothetical protein
MNLTKIDDVKTIDDFIAFIRLMRESAERGGQDVECFTVAEYLDSIASYVESVRYRTLQSGLTPISDPPDWRSFAAILGASL